MQGRIFIIPDAQMNIQLCKEQFLLLGFADLQICKFNIIYYM